MCRIQIPDHPCIHVVSQLVFLIKKVVSATSTMHTQTRAQGKQDPENHIQALPTVASATDAGYGTVNRTPTFCGI